MNWLNAIKYTMENPNKKLFNNKNDYALCNYNEVPMILKEKGIYTSVILNSEFCESEWREPIILTKYNINVCIDNCLINSHEKWINDNNIKTYVEDLYSQFKKEFNTEQDEFLNTINIKNSISPVIRAYELHKVEIKYQPMFDENLNIIRKEE